MTMTITYNMNDTGYGVMVTGLATSITEEELNELFVTKGPVKKISLHFDSSDKSKGIADVVYYNRDNALQAVDYYHNREIYGAIIKVYLLSKDDTPVAPIPVVDQYIHKYILQYTSLCRSVILGVKCTHSVCRYAHDVEKIVLLKCRFEGYIKGCINVTCVGNGLYRNKGSNVCKYIHSNESRDSYYKRLDIYKFKK
jgi:hypothetical protein